MQFAVEGHSVYAYTGARVFDAALPTIVCVHGAACDHSVWALQSRYFAHHGANVLAVDLPGHGRSTGDALPSVHAIADWIVALLDAVAVERAVLVGHSMGSLAVLDAAGRFAQRVSKLALLAPAVPMPVSDLLLAAAEADDHVAFELITGWSYSDAHQLGGNAQPGVWMTGNGLRLMERSRPGVLYADLRACHEYDAGLAAAAGIRCPVLLIVGQRDQMAPAKNIDSLAAALLDKRLVTIPGCGHSLMIEAPDAVLDALRSFLLHAQPASAGVIGGPR
jgi:pimeloyl-ACP methyl ester carboxylesterase